MEVYTLKIICRAQTSANAQGYNNSPNILITTDRIFINFLPEIDLEPKKVLIIFRKPSVEHIPPPNTSNDAPITTDHIFMKILPEMHQGPRKSPLHF